jgi:hypothetical protein
MSTIITPSEEQINIVVNDEKISINVESGDVIVNVNEQIVEVSTVNGAYPLPTTVYSVFGRTGNIIAVDGDYDLGELGDVTLVSSTNGDVLTYDGTKWINKAVTGTGTVTSVDMSVPIGLQVSGNPITINGTIALNYASGYSLPTTVKQTTWDAAYNDSIVSASVSGTTTKTLTLNQQDGGTITASWTDIDTNLVTSVNGYVGTVVLTTTDIAEGTRLYYTEARVSNNVDVAANTAARHAALTIGTANGLSLASQVLSLALASASTTGALSSTDWVKFNTAYNDSIVSANVSGTTTKTLTLTQQDAGTITASWTDLAASGTVTSVAATVPTGLTISGSPIVSAGTLAFGLDTGYTIPLSTQLVPSGGSTGQLLAKNSATNYDTLWIDNYTEQLRDTVKAAVAINKGQAVYVSGANGTNQLVSLASNATEGTSSKTLGLASQNFAINDIGQIITEGLLAGLDTSTATAGDPVWLGVSGNLIYGLANKPVAPAHLVYIGVVTRVNINNGEIYVKIQNGFELREIHDVLISSVANNEGLFYESATSLWKNKSIATVLGYTPISLTSLSGVSPLSYNNTTGAFSIAQATISVNGYLSSTDWNTFNGKQAALNGTGFVKATGTTISYDNSSYYLASNPNAYIALTGLSATAPLSYNNTTGGFTISQAGVSGDGYLSSTDWNTFNNKQASGSYITALSGEATASGPGSAAVTLSTSAVTGKILTGVNITGGSISATDSILVAFGKVQNQINGVLGGAIYQSVWNASTNSPTLTSGTGTKGYYYIVSVAGSINLDGITDWKVGDWAIFNGTTWNKVDNTDAVSSVNGYTGAVSLTTSDITEGSRLYYTEGRVSANTDVAANTAARHAAVTIGTANGLSLSTQALSLALASTSATGALSSTDWNTFNLKQAALSGTGFVKISGSTISYDNSTYLTTSAAASTYLALAGGIMTGQIVLKEASSSTDYTKGLRFPNDPFGGSGDIAGMRLYNTFSENMVLELYTGNDGAGDIINFATGVGGTANNDSVTINGNKIWNLGNLPSPQSAITLTTTGSSGSSTFVSNTLNIPTYTLSGLGGQPQLNGTGFVKASGTTISYDNSTYLTTSAAASTYLPLAGGTLTGPLGGTSATFTSSGKFGGDVYNAAILTASGTKSNIGSFNNGILAVIDNNALGTNIGGSIEFRGIYTSAGDFTTSGVISTYKNNSSSGDYGYGMQLYTRPNGGSPTVALTLASTGAATFSSSIAATSATFSGSVIVGTTALLNFGPTSSFVGMSGNNSTGALQLYANNTQVLGFASSTGAATFSSSVTAASGTFSISAGSTLQAFQTSATNSLTALIRQTGGGGNGNQDIGLVVDIQGAADNDRIVNFRYYDGTNYNSRFVVQRGGNVGIGTSSPSSKLDVITSGYSYSASPLKGTGMNLVGAAGSGVGGGDGTASGVLNIIDNAAMGINNGGTITLGGNYIGSGNAYALTYAGIKGGKENATDYNSAGYLAFYTTSSGASPTEKMRIASSGAITATSSVTATSFFESSDSRLKTLIQDNYQTKGIASITPKLYTKNGKVELGYYAQDFVGVLDSAVSKGSDDMLSLSYREVLVAKVYALEQRIKELENK